MPMIDEDDLFRLLRAARCGLPHLPQLERSPCAATVERLMPRDRHVLDSRPEPSPEATAPAAPPVAGSSPRAAAPDPAYQVLHAVRRGVISAADGLRRLRAARVPECDWPAPLLVAAAREGRDEEQNRLLDGMKLQLSDAVRRGETTPEDAVRRLRAAGLIEAEVPWGVRMAPRRRREEHGTGGSDAGPDVA